MPAGVFSVFVATSGWGASAFFDSVFPSPVSGKLPFSPRLFLSRLLFPVISKILAEFCKLSLFLIHFYCSLYAPVFLPFADSLPRRPPPSPSSPSSLSFCPARAPLPTPAFRTSAASLFPFPPTSPLFPFVPRLRIFFRFLPFVHTVFIFLCYTVCSVRTISSVGQSNRLITGRSKVRALDGPPKKTKSPTGAFCFFALFTARRGAVPNDRPVSRHSPSMIASQRRPVRAAEDLRVVCARIKPSVVLLKKHPSDTWTFKIRNGGIYESSSGREVCLRHDRISAKRQEGTSGCYVIKSLYFPSQFGFSFLL